MGVRSGATLLHGNALRQILRLVDRPSLAVRDAITSLIFTTGSQELVRDPSEATNPVDRVLIDTIVDGLFVDD